MRVDLMQQAVTSTYRRVDSLPADFRLELVSSVANTQRIWCGSDTANVHAVVGCLVAWRDDSEAKCAKTSFYAPLNTCTRWLLDMPKERTSVRH